MNRQQRRHPELRHPLLPGPGSQYSKESLTAPNEYRKNKNNFSSKLFKHNSVIRGK